MRRLTVSLLLWAAIGPAVALAERPDLCLKVQQDGTVLLQPDTQSGYRWRATDEPTRLRLLFIDSRGLPDEAEYSVGWEADGERRKIKPRPQPQPQPKPQPQPNPAPPDPTPPVPAPNVEPADLYAIVLENPDLREPWQATVDLWATTTLKSKEGKNRYLRYDVRDTTLPSSIKAMVAAIPAGQQGPWLFLQKRVPTGWATAWKGPEPKTIEEFKSLFKQHGGAL